MDGAGASEGASAGTSAESGAGVILVTGASRGIGRGVALTAAKAGYAVGVNYRTREEAAQTVVAEIEAAGGRAIALQADVAEADAVEAMVDRLGEAFGPMTAIVNNAGDVARRQPLDEMPLDDIERLVSVNLMGTIHGMRAATRVFKANGGGGIVNVGSEAGRFGGNRISVYAATKAAVGMLTVGAARELAAHNIRVNAVSPGTILTDALAQEGEAVLDNLRRTLPMGRIGEPEEVGEAVLWLLSPAASYVSGTVLPISGAR